MATKLSAAQKLKNLKKKATRTEPSSKKKEVRVLDVHPSLHPQIRELCEVAVLADEIKPKFEQRKSAIADAFFDLWTAEMWANKKKPDNFYVRLKSLDEEGNPTALDDVQCQFQLKPPSNSTASRKVGIGKKLPNSDDLPEVDCKCEGKDKDCEVCEGNGTYQQTVEEVLALTLTSPAVGLTEPKAWDFVKSEVKISDDFDLSIPLNKMTEKEDGTPLKTLGDKIVEYLHARARKEGGKVTLVGITDEEVIEGLKYYQVATLKAGFMERIYQYADNVDQLRKLLRLLEVVTQVSNFDFAMSGTAGEKFDRLQDAVNHYLVDEDDEDDS